jgi:hypothetical protein
MEDGSIEMLKEYVIDEEFKLKYNEIEDEWDYFQNNLLVPKTSGKLYKYYSANMNNIDSLLNQYFYLTNPTHFNDPFDCNINLAPGIGINEGIERIEGFKKNNFSNVGVSCFSEEIDNPLMWAHYTNNYRGFALEFKDNQIVTSPKKSQLLRTSFTKVTYLKRLVRISSKLPFSFHYMLSTKHKQWLYEKEWRIVAEIGKKPTDRFLEFKNNMVKAIYIGHTLIDENSSEMRLIFKACEFVYPKVPLYVVYPNFNEFTIVKKEINDIIYKRTK